MGYFPSEMIRQWSKSQLNKEIARALARGRRRALSEPRAARARYDRRTGRVAVDLTNGCSFVFPARSLEGLARASDGALADIEILGSMGCIGPPSTPISQCRVC